MTDKLSWGILSTANIAAKNVVPAMQKSDRLTVAAIASRDGARARQAADALGIETAHSSYEALLADPAIDVIYNPLPNHLHVPWTIKAMEAGKHVLCEKPVALTADEAELLVDARERTGKLVAEAFMVRHHPQWKRVVEIVRSGKLGTVRVVQTMFAYHNVDPQNVRNLADIGGGAVYDIGCYAIATGRLVFGTEPERVVAVLDRDPEMKIDRLSSAIVTFGEGARLVFTCSTQLVPSQSVDIYGTKQKLRVEVPFNQDPMRPSRLLIDDGSALKGGPETVEEVPPANQYMLQAEAFGDAVSGAVPLAFPIEDAVANMRVIDALLRSGETGAWETIA